MTIHRAKGLEFAVVCVADLGRAPRRSAELLRIGRAGRFGLRLARAGTGRRTPALDYEALGEELLAREAAEERRLFYVAMTRARERLILSGAARLDRMDDERLPDRLDRAGVPARDRRRPRRGRRGERAQRRLRDRPARSGRARRPARRPGELRATRSPARPQVGADGQAAAALLPPVTLSLSYSALAEYEHCGYRFYVERVLRIPAVAIADELRGAGAIERGIVLHALLERFDFRRPQRPSAEAIAQAVRGAGIAGPPPPAAEVAATIERFGASELCGRLARAGELRREQPFSFVLHAADQVFSGVLDVLARERDGGTLVIDYKSDRLEQLEPADVVARQYGAQRLIYAIAALRAGAREVEIAYVFLERPDAPVMLRYELADLVELELELVGRTAGIRRGEFAVSETPHRRLCAGCPAEGGLCSWPRELTRREAPDRLF